MKTYTIERRQTVRVPRGEVFAFFANASNLNLLTPPWLRFGFRRSPPEDLRAGTEIEYTIRWHGLPMRWLTEITEWTPELRFVDSQRRGPYRLWRHTHLFESAGDETILRDIVEYALPLGLLGRLVHACMVRRDVESIFDYRADRIRQLMPDRVPLTAMKSA